MNREEKLDSNIPIDLIIEINSRLPAKSIARFRCVSKLWESMLSRPSFTELFLTRSWARPRILFILRRGNEWSFFSSPQPHNTYDNALVVADFHMKFSKNMGSDFRGVSFTSGLVYFSTMHDLIDSENKRAVICNPSTGHYVILPKLLRRYRWADSFLGYDPIEKQHKVVLMASPCYTADHKILTLGDGNKWKKLECSLGHDSWSQKICINGVLYYLAARYDEKYNDYGMVVCFDVRSEKFKFIDDIEVAYCDTELVNYKGKLGGIRWKYVGNNNLELHLWILEDVKKQEFSKYVYTLGEDVAVDACFILGVTNATSEIVFSTRETSKPFYVYYFNPERNTLRTVKIQGLESDDSWVYAFVDFVEDLNVNDSIQLKSRLANRGLNIIRTRPQPQQRRRRPTSSSRDLSKSALHL